MLEVKIFAIADNWFGTEIFATFKFVIVAFCEFKSTVLVVIKFEVEALVVEAFDTRKLDVFPKITAIFADKTEIKFEIMLSEFKLSNFKFVPVAFAKIKLLNVGLLVKEYVTFPNVSVATLKFVDEAKNLYKLESEVVASTPLTFAEITELFSVKDILLEFIKLDVASSPFTIEVIVFTAEFKEF